MDKDSLDNRDVRQGGKLGVYDDIYFKKQRGLSLVVLGVLFFASVLSAVIALFQGVFVRQVINSAVAIVVLVCIIATYKYPRKVSWSAYIATVFLHLIGTSGFVSNGGVASYAASLLPVIPIVTMLLVGKRASVVSLIYVLLLGMVSGVLTIYEKNPANMTVLEYRPAFAMYLTAVSIVSGFVAVFSLIATTQSLNDDVRSYTSKLEKEALARQEAEHKAHEASLAKSQFLATISHELRTPLNSIIGFTQQLNKLELPERGKGCADQITVSSKELLKKVNDLLEYTETVYSKSNIKMESFVIEDLFSALVAMFVDKKNNNTLILECTDLKNKVIISDAVKIKKIINNIIDNALEYTDGGEVIVKASIQRINSASMLVCDIEDSGIGIDEGKIDALFDVFTQHDMSSSRSHEGVGLGLASSYSLVSLLDGTLSAKNNEGKGCTFYVKIPVILEGKEG